MVVMKEFEYKELSAKAESLGLSLELCVMTHETWDGWEIELTEKGLIFAKEHGFPLQDFTGFESEMF